MNHAHKKQQGFTLIELSLAMTFISFLLIGIAMTIIQVAAIYNRGTTSKDLNQLSREINVDIDRNISAAGSLNLSTDYVNSPASASAQTADGGRLCLGTYSYVWNYAEALEKNNGGVAKYPAGNDAVVRLVKVEDPGSVYCTKNPRTGLLANKDIRSQDVGKTKELLQVGDHTLGLHSFVFKMAPDSAMDATTGQQIYSLSYIVGTTRISALNIADSTIDPAQTACLAAGKPNADPLYCNVQKFSLVVRTGNGVN